MDLNTVQELRDARSPHDWRPGDAWLAGGTWLFSEPQPHLRRLVDLTTLGWEPLLPTADGGLEIAATATIERLAAYPHPLFAACAEAFLASSKVRSVATVGGNLCTALPAGPMISLTAALDGWCLLVAPDGTRRTLPVAEFVTGDGTTALTPGELLRSVSLPKAALDRPAAMRQASLYALGRSAALVIGIGQAYTVTASTTRPYTVRFPAPPTADELAAGIEATVPAQGWFDDVHGTPVWRRHMTFRLAEQVRVELAGAS